MSRIDNKLNIIKLRLQYIAIQIHFPFTVYLVRILGFEASHKSRILMVQYLYLEQI